MWLFVVIICSQLLYKPNDQPIKPTSISLRLPTLSTNRVAIVAPKCVKIHLMFQVRLSLAHSRQQEGN